jgi:hypothetical protein
MVSAARVVGMMWHLVRIPVLVVLVVLEPIVRVVLGAAALLGLLACAFFSLIEGPRGPHFPLWTMLAIPIGIGLILVGYSALCIFFGARDSLTRGSTRS